MSVALSPATATATKRDFSLATIQPETSKDTKFTSVDDQLRGVFVATILCILPSVM